MSIGTKDIRAICSDIEHFAVGLNRREAIRNARMNAARAQGAFRLLQPFLPKNINKFKILNLSGINTAEFDICLNHQFLENGYSIDSWTAYDSKENVYLQSETVGNALESCGIKIVNVDFSEDYEIIELPDSDIILLCDVIEHLDYSDALKLLVRVYENAHPGSIVLVTCPNPAWLIDRIKGIFGEYDWFDCDIKSHLSGQLYGHINIYPKKRLKAIFEAINYEILDTGTFNHWRYALFDGSVKYLLQIGIDLTNLITKNCGFTTGIILKVNK